VLSGAAGDHPRLFFSADEVPAIRARASTSALQPTAARLRERARWLLTAPPIVPSVTKRGEPDPPGELKGIQSARRLQGRVATLALAFRLEGDRRFRDAAVENLRRAIDEWRIWVDTAHQPPFDLMTGEISVGLAIGYDWLYADLTPEERALLERGAERALTAYLDAVNAGRSWHTSKHNWNTVCNGGAALLALAMQDVSPSAVRVLALAVPAMDHYWNHLADDGGWDEGTGYWAYGHRYAFMAAEALRRAGRPGGAERFARPGAARTGFFPIVFNPGTKLCASFGDSAHRAEDPLYYLLARQYREPAFAWYQDRVPLWPVDREGWPQEALALIWRPAGEAWLPERQPAGYSQRIDSPALFGSIGWGMLASRLPDPPSFLAFKNGSLAANHTHLDLNTVTIGFGDEMLLVDLGSRPYPADYFDAKKRYGYYEITTRGHNTVLVGGRGQALGRAGTLKVADSGAAITALTGIADGAYEVETPRAHRHAVRLPGDIYVVVDDLQHASPQPIELRFHTYARIAGAGNRFVFTGDTGSMDVVIASPGVTTRAESPDGWIRPVNVLSVSRAAAAAHTVVTVFHPRPTGSAPMPDAQVRETGAGLVVSAGGHAVELTRKGDGLHLVPAAGAPDRVR
jgi:hypothetical protein